MQIVYAQEPFPTEVVKTLFLAGPTPRGTGRSWREEALITLERMGYDGHVFVPEDRDSIWKSNYDSQVEWEEEALNRADCIVFWVPRDITGEKFYGCPMPAFTTNDEWGAWKDSGKVVWGAPGVAEKVTYQTYYAKKLAVPNACTLGDTLSIAVKRLGEGARRVDGECQVPLHIWEKREFQGWLYKLNGAGNRLDGCRVLWTFWVGSNRDFLFSWALHVNIYIGTEKRPKDNEFVLFRTDVTAVVPYRPHGDFLDSEIVLVKEFRSPVRNLKGFVYELPGGSTKKTASPETVALLELAEEAGLNIAPERVHYVGSRQVAATLSAHTASVFSVELTEDEMAYVRAMNGQTFGVQEDTEVTYPEVHTLRDILGRRLVDWANIGMIFSAIQSTEAHRLDRESRLRAAGFEEPSDSQRRDQLARNIALQDWPK